MLRFNVQQALWSGKINLRIADISSGKLSVAKQVIFEQIPEGSYFEDSLLSLDPNEAQELANQLYAAGIRPEQAAGSAGQLDSVRYHLEDMRKLVFKGEAK